MLVMVDADKRYYRFNTASGMRSHVTDDEDDDVPPPPRFQYRKRYEVTCDINSLTNSTTEFRRVSIPQAV